MVTVMTAAAAATAASCCHQRQIARPATPVSDRTAGGCVASPDCVPPPTHHVLKRSDVIGIDPITRQRTTAADGGHEYTKAEVIDLTLLNIVRKNELVHKYKVLDLFFSEQAARQLIWNQRRNPDQNVGEWPAEDKNLY